MKKGFILFNLLVIGFLLFTISSRATGVHFTLNPVNDTVCETTTSVSFSVAAIDTPGTHTINYLWQVSTNGGASWSTASASAFSGDSTSMLTVTLDGTTSLSGDMFRCIASDTSTSATSSFAVLVVQGTPNAGTITGPTSVCIGSTAVYHDATPGGVWSTTNSSLATISATGVLTGVAAGFDTVAYSVTNLCSTAIASVDSVAIDTLPNAGSISGNDSVCKGSTLSLSETVTGGVWSSSSTGVATVGTSGTVASVSQGFTSISYTVTNSLGCAGIASMTIRVDTVAVPLPISGPDVTCVTHTIDLTDGNIYGISTWSASNSTASVNSLGQVHGISGGVDTIRLHFTNACNSVDTNIVIEIDTPLATGTLSGASVVCTGSWIHLTASRSFGFWLSDNSAIATVDASGNVTGITQGTVTISYLFENGCGVRAAVASITVYAPADIIAAATDSVGIDSSLTLSDATPGGTWSSSDATVATIGATTGIVTGIGTGSATISYTVTNVCGTTYSIFALYVGPPPSAGIISPDIDSVCAGFTITLSESVPGGMWSSGDNTLATIDDAGLVTGIAQGLVIMTYTVTNRFGTSVALQAVYVNRKALIKIGFPAVVSVGGDYFPIAGPEGGYWTSSNYQIGFLAISAFGRDGDTLIGGVEYTGGTWCSLVILKPGIDTLHYIYENACGRVDSMYILKISGNNGVNTITGEANSVSLFPNPNIGSFTLNLTSENTEEANVIITNIVGQEVKEMTISTNQSNDINLDLPSGTYFMTAKTPNNRYVAKFTISR